MTSITAFKGFDPDLKCRGFQYEVGKTYEHEGKVEICGSGFHACENPFDVWNYYGPIDARYALVEMAGETDKARDGDSKIAAGKIVITAELSAGQYTKKCVDWLIEKTKGKASSGDYSKQASSGYGSKQASSGYGSKQASSGDVSQQASSGDGSQQASSGDYTHHIADGKNTAICCSGVNSTAEGIDGTHISLAEWVNDECVGFATGCIGKDGLEPKTRYKAKGGKLVEAAS